MKMGAVAVPGYYFTSKIVHSLSARKPLAFAKWQYPYTLTAEQKMKKAQLDRIEELEHPYPEGSNRELYDVFFAALREKKAKWMDASKDYCKSESATKGPDDDSRLNLRFLL